MIGTCSFPWDYNMNGLEQFIPEVTPKIIITRYYMENEIEELCDKFHVHEQNILELGENYLALLERVNELEKKVTGTSGGSYND